MSVAVTLEYARVGNTLHSKGRILSDENGQVTEEGLPLECSFVWMMTRLGGTLGHWPDEPEILVVLRRTDHPNLSPYVLDKATVALMRKDPEAAAATFEFPQHTPSDSARRVAQAKQPIVPPLVIGVDVASEAFGDDLYFKVREHELECPGCGFWGMFISPGLLHHEDRAGECAKCIFICSKKCHVRLPVTCLKKWGYVSTEYLLNHTKLGGFYFPRAWNEGKPWVTREALKKKYDEYLTEKEKEQAT